MGFFATFWSWLNGQLAAYIGDNTSRLAAALEPAVVTLATIYVMAWGYLHLTGTIDAIWDSGGTVAGNLWQKGGLLSGDFGFYLAGAVVWCLIGVLCVYAMFLIALSSIALAVLLALGPLFIALLFFDATRRFFTAWIAQLAHYGLITELTLMAAALLLRIVQSYAAQTAARGTAILTVDALNMMLIALLVFLVLRQIMPIASGLAGGSSLNSFGVASRGFSSLARRAVGRATPILGLGAEIAVAGAGAAAQSTGRAVRTVAGRASAGIHSLARSWRDGHR